MVARVRVEGAREVAVGAVDARRQRGERVERRVEDGGAQLVRLHRRAGGASRRCASSLSSGCSTSAAARPSAARRARVRPSTRRKRARGATSGDGQLEEVVDGGRLRRSSCTRPGRRRRPPSGRASPARSGARAPSWRSASDRRRRRRRAPARLRARTSWRAPRSSWREDERRVGADVHLRVEAGVGERGVARDQPLGDRAGVQRARGDRPAPTARRRRACAGGRRAAPRRRRARRGAPAKASPKVRPGAIVRGEERRDLGAGGPPGERLAHRVDRVGDVGAEAGLGHRRARLDAPVADDAQPQRRLGAAGDGTVVDLGEVVILGRHPEDGHAPARPSRRASASASATAVAAL